MSETSPVFEVESRVQKELQSLFADSPVSIRKIKIWPGQAIQVLWYTQWTNYETVTAIREKIMAYLYQYFPGYTYDVNF